ncbi:MAG TPA: hypothetical protein VGX91_07180 [Candidatus Cybelea sp.]|nr:hypothetical protein [Candidatus Cybelea sp.]
MPPAAVQEAPARYRRAVRLNARIVELVLQERDGGLAVQASHALGVRDTARARAIVERMFRYGDDLSPFYARIAGDPLLAWAAAGAGRILASPSVFEDVIKTICTTNCAWSATIRMNGALVALGGGAFPEPELLAGTGLQWYRDVARMGYRGAYVRAIAQDVASGGLDLESLAGGGGISDAEVEERLLALPGIGPYGAAHVMQLLGRHRPLVLDSWTRPQYLRLAQRKRAGDATIRRAFARYGEYAGLAFWLFLTRTWVAD